MLFFRPIRSEIAPNTGWSSMYITSTAVITTLTVPAAIWAVLTRNFCIYVVNV